jgi:DNA-binding response OmpR family regulator
VSGAPLLIIEDDQDIRESLVEFLEDHGYRVDAARDGREALDHLVRARERPCLIVLDLMMPVMDGQQFRAEQLRDPELSQIPVLLISAYGDVEERASDLGRLPFLRKPFDLEQLLEQVEARCRIAAASSAAGKTAGAASR